MKCRGCLLLALFCFCSHVFAQAKQKITSNIAIILGTTIVDSLPSPAFEQRILHGVHLYQNGTVQKLLFTGGKVHGRKYAEADVAYRYAIKKGIPAQDIIVENKATNTIENIRLVKLHLDTTHYKNVYLVTDSIHIKRAVLIAQEENISAIPSPSSTQYIPSSLKKFKYKIRETLYRTLYSISNFLN